MASSYILALDQGTTSSRSVLVDSLGRICFQAQEEFEQHYPQPGWVEHDPWTIWHSQMRTVHAVLAQAGIHPRDLKGIGITNQRETTVVWNRETGQPIYNAIVWQDRRTSELCTRLKNQGHHPTIQHQTGLVLDSYFSGTKIHWILENVPGAHEKALAGKLAFGTIDSWLIWNLTNGQSHVTDASNASRTLLFDIHNMEWSDELCEILSVPRSMLPTVVDSSGICAEANLDGTLVPIAGIAGDQQAALFGQQCTEPGMVKNTYGTGCFMLMNTGSRAIPSQNNLLTTVAWQRNGQPTYALEGSVFIAGAVVQWIRDEMNWIKDSAEIESLAARVDDNGGLTLVPAFAGLGAPHWEAEARGTMFGLTRGSQAGHIARAALESIALQTADVLMAMENDAGIELKELRVDGGASMNPMLMQFQADVLNVSVIRPQTHETTALGAAYLAGLAVGMWPSEEALASHWQRDAVFETNRDDDWRRIQLSAWVRAIEAVKVWSQHQFTTEKEN